MRKGQEYDCRPNLFLSLGMCQPFLAMFNTKQEECFNSQRRGVSASRPPALFLLRCAFPLVQLLLFQVCGGTQRCLASRWRCRDIWEGRKDRVWNKVLICGSNSIRKWEWANLLLQSSLSVLLVYVSALVVRLP